MNNLKKAQLKTFLTNEIRKENKVSFSIDGIEVSVKAYGEKETPITTEGRLKFPKLAQEQDASFSKPISFKCRAFCKHPYVGCGGFRYVDTAEEGADEVMREILWVEKQIRAGLVSTVICY